MDDIADTVGKLSLAAKEWRPGQGFAAPTVPTRSSSAPETTMSSNTSRGVTTTTGYGSRESSWAATTTTEPSRAIDVNGTHYFGSTPSSINNNNTETTASYNNTNTTVPSHHHHLNPRATLRNTLSLPADDYRHYRELSLQSSSEMDPNDPRHKAVPSSFCRAYCLDNNNNTNSNNNNQTNKKDGGGGSMAATIKNTNTIISRSSFGYPTCLFRVTSTSDGHFYTLRRIDSVRCVSHKIIQNVMNMWITNNASRWEGKQQQQQRTNGSNSLFDHPGVVSWYKCFISQRAVFFVHHYHVGAVTLKERFFNANNNNNGNNVSGLGLPLGSGGGVPLPEPFIWSCLTQLVSAIAAIHRSNLAVRTLQLNHILCTREGPSATSSGMSSLGFPKLRFRINCIGIIDILEFEARKSLDELQMEDMRALGCIILSMTTGTEITMDDLYRNNTTQQQMMALGQYGGFVRQHYSRELHALVEVLLNPNMQLPMIHEVARGMAMHVLEEMDGAHACMDGMNNALAGVYESGRALRIMLKLAFVNERPEFGIDQNWSESGDCYILKLFRDFVFHQADGSGRPVMDLGHVISSLNKLDAADEEKIVLTSRDGKNILVVSFADVAWCLEKCYQELCSSSVPHPSLP